MDEAAKLAPFPFVGDADPVPASLFVSYPEQANTLALLYEVSREITSILDREELLRRVAQRVRNSSTTTFLASCFGTKGPSISKPLSQCVTAMRSPRETAFLSIKGSPEPRPPNAAAFALRTRSPILAFLPVRWRPAFPCARNWSCRY